MITFLLLYISLLVAPPETGFKEQQMTCERVKTAYHEKYTTFAVLLNQKNIRPDQLEILIRIFKEEGILELWGRNRTDQQFTLLRNYDICASSGHAGPKRMEGDFQVPEGYYHLVNFNPWSSFYLSMSIDYPNASDKRLSDKTHPGGNICIHGNCVTIGCIPITDDCIKELYMAAVEAKNNGQRTIHTAIFPCRLEDDALEKLKTAYAGNQDYCNLWTSMKTEYDYFKQHHRQPRVTVLNDGRYQVE